MKNLLKTISLFLILFLTIPNTFGNTTIYEGEYLKVYNIFYNAFSDNSERELNAKLEEVYRLIHLKETRGIRELLYIIKNSLGDLIYEKYPKDTSCDDILGPGGWLYEYDISDMKSSMKIGEGGKGGVGEDGMGLSIRNTKMKKGDVVSIKFKTLDLPYGMIDTYASEFAGEIVGKTIIISKYKCDINSKDNIYVWGGSSISRTSQVSTYKKEFNNFGYDVLERDKIYYITFLNRYYNRDGTFSEDNCPEGKYCGFVFGLKISYFKPSCTAKSNPKDCYYEN